MQYSIQSDTPMQSSYRPRWSQRGVLTAGFGSKRGIDEARRAGQRDAGRERERQSMEDGQELATESSLQDQAAVGQKYLEGTVEAAHEILASLDEVLGNPLLWAQPAPSPALDTSGKPVGGGVPQQEQAWVALETGRLRYRDTSARLRASITAIFNHPLMRLQEGDSAKEKGPVVDLHQLELKAAQLREEAVKKNQMLKLVIDQSRDLVSDIAMWQNAEL